MKGIKIAIQLFILGVLFIDKIFCTITHCINEQDSKCLQCEANYYVLVDKLCVTQCLDDQYNDGIKCITCSNSIANCWTCTSSTVCSKCFINYNLRSPSKCSLIINNCSLYSADYSTCQTCETDYYLSDDHLKCVSSCDKQIEGFIKIGTTCFKCSSPCKTCSGTVTNCTSCQSSNYFLDSNLNPSYSGELTCQTLCNSPITSYVDENNRCQPCSSSCLGCKLNAQYCVSCFKNKYLQLITGRDFGVCQSDCNSGFYGNASTNTCDPCSDKCDKCSNSSYCLKCLSGSSLKLVSSTQISCVDFGSQQDGFFFNNTTQQYEPCSSSCKLCEGNSTFCSGCNSPLLLDRQQGKCFTTCPINKLEDNKECKNCTDLGVSHCNRCQRQAPNVVQCTSCQLGYYLSNSQCVICNPTCKDCVDSPTKCTLCFSPKVLENNVCKDTCSSSNYKDVNLLCQKCNTECKTCFGDSYNCTSCTDTKQFIDLIDPLVLNKYTCKNSCNDAIRYYRDANNYCQPCSDNCYQCSQSAVNCVSCLGNMFLKSSIDANKNPINICSQTCQITEYKDTTTGFCKACHSSCYSCSGALSTNCTSCKSPTILTIDLNLNYKCTDSCNLSGGYFLSSQSMIINDVQQKIDTCQQCSSSCLNCEGSATTCTKCTTLQSLYGNQCVGSCPIGYFKKVSSDNLSSICIKCYSRCQKCSNETELCDECKDQFYKDPTDMKCYPCEFPCKGCLGSATTCTSCFDAMYYIQASNKCQYSCQTNNGEYIKIGTNICDKCDSKCLTCQDYLDNCIICSSNFKQNKCVSNCETGWYFDGVSSCLLCDDNCQACNSKTYCNQCKNQLKLQKVDSSTQICVSSCYEGYYANGSQCSNCDSSCKTCNGGTNSNCLSCYSSQFSTNIYLQDSKCQSACDTGQIADANYKCQKCTENCKTCKSSTQCDKCEDQYQPTSDKTKCVCKDGTFFDPIDSLCKDCIVMDYVYNSDTFEYDYVAINNSGSCKTCEQVTTYNNSCLTCFDNFYLEAVYDGADVPQLKYNKCTECDSNLNCNTCSSTSNIISCDTCKEGNFLYEVTDIVQGQSITYQRCVKCSVNCKSCNKYSSCITCNDGYQLDENNNCIKICYGKDVTKSYLPLQNQNFEYSCFYGANDIKDNCIRKNCKSPTDPICQEQCTLCKIGYFLDENKNCIQECQQDYTKKYNSSNQTWGCIKITDCAKYDQYGQDCVKCLPSYYLKKDSLLTSCVKTCGDGYYVRKDKVSGNKCYKCSSNCKTCQYQSDNCTTCDALKFKSTIPHKIPGRGDEQKSICVSDCPPKTTKNLQNQTCFSCSNLCKSCEDNKEKCLDCQDGTVKFQLVDSDPNVITYPSFLDATIKTKIYYVCLLNCSRNALAEKGFQVIKSYYTNINRQCQICPPGCIECNPSAATVKQESQDAINKDILEFQCSVCDTKLNYFSNRYGGCKLSICGDGFTDDNEECDDGNNNDFDGCNSDCVIESGWSCTNKKGKNSLCQTKCGDSFIAIYKIGGKETCDAGQDQGKVDGCSSQCTVKPGYFCDIPKNSSKSQCGDPCGGKCKKCQINQDGITSCIECVNNNLFINGKDCVDKCQEGFFRNPINQQCQATCPSLYSSKDYVSRLCVSSCPQNLYSVNKSSYYECLADCPIGFFKDIDQGIKVCKPCHATCSVCAGPLATDCIKCSDSSLLLHIHDFYHVCKSSCDIGFIKDSLDGYNVCVPCQGDRICSDCAPNLYFFNGKCSPQCNMPNTSKDMPTWSCYFNSIPQIQILEENTTGVYGFVKNYKLKSLIDPIYQVQSYLWTLLEEKDDVINQFFDGISFKSQDLVIKGQNLISDKTYKIQLEVKVNLKSYFATIQITTMKNPTIELFVTPLKGQYMNTIFQFKTLGWPSYLNKNYQFTLIAKSSINTANDIQIHQGTSLSDISKSFSFPLQSSDQIYTIELNILTNDFKITPKTLVYLQAAAFTLDQVSTTVQNQKFTSVYDVSSTALSFNQAGQESIKNFNAVKSKQQILYQNITNLSDCSTQDNCNNNGKCQIISNQIQCKCKSGSTGQYCQYSSEEKSNIQNIIQKIYNELERYGIDSYNQYEFAVALDSSTDFTDTFNRTTINSLRRNLRQFLQIGSLNEKTLPRVLSASMGYLQICQYNYRQNYLLKQFIDQSEADYVHSDLVAIGSNQMQQIDKSLSDVKFYNDDGNTIMDNIISNQAAYYLPEDDGHLYGQTATTKVSIHNYQRENILSLMKFNKSTLVRMLQKDQIQHQINNNRNLQTAKSTVSLIDFSEVFLTDLKSKLTSQNVGSFSIAQIEYTITDPFISKSQVMYSSTLKIGLVDKKSGTINVSYESSQSGYTYLVYLQKTSLVPGQNAVCAVYNLKEEQYEDNKKCILQKQDNPTYYICKCSTFGYISIKEFAQLGLLEDIEQKSFFERILSNFGFMFSISNLCLLLILILTLLIFKKDKDILQEDFKALHPLYSIVFINDILNPREVRVLLFFLTIAQQAFFESVLFLSPAIQDLGVYSIPIIGVCGIIISSCLNYLTGIIHFFSVFKESPYLKKWLVFYFVVFIQLVGYYVAFTKVADDLDNKILPIWLSTFFTGFLVDVLILDMVFMVLAIKIKYVKNLVQVRGFFSGKIITLDELKKEKLQQHIDSIQQKLHFLQNEQTIKQQLYNNKKDIKQKQQEIAGVIVTEGQQQTLVNEVIQFDEDDEDEFLSDEDSNHSNENNEDNNEEKSKID